MEANGQETIKLIWKYYVDTLKATGLMFAQLEIVNLFNNTGKFL